MKVHDLIYIRNVVRLSWLLNNVFLIVDMIGGGTDTISLTLTWNIAIMCNCPEVQRKAAAGIDEFIKINGHLSNFKEQSKFPTVSL